MTTTTKRKHMPTSLAPNAKKRSFQLTVRPAPGDDRYGLLLEETHENGSVSITRTIADTTAAQAARVADAITAAIRASGHPATILRPSRRSPITLDEPVGVRLALHLTATSPLTRTDRIRAVVAGINTMSVEETYYWYAKTSGSNRPRALRSLRLLLADDHPRDESK